MDRGDGVGVDPVVQEVDVYLSKQLADNLFLFQYPVRPASMPYDYVNHFSAKMKPEQQRVELELEVNTRSANYATGKGEQIAINVDGDSGHYYHSDCMDKQVLSSNCSGAPTSRYVVGTYKDGELHVTPLKGLVQLRPAFGYMDLADTRQKTAAASAAEGGDQSQDEEEPAKAVTMKFAGRESEEAKARRMASYEYMTKKNEEEQWVRMQYHQHYDSIASAERNLMYARQTSEVCEFQSASESYLQNLIPKMEEGEEAKPALPNNVLSLAELKSMSLGDQIKALLVNAKVIKFNQLISLLPKGTDTTTALRFIQQVALMVQGCWVVKSEVLYPKDSHSAHSGVASETLCRARDYVMWRFTQSRILIRKDIASVVRLVSEDLKDILEQMAQVRINKGWEFVMTYDSEFVVRHPDVVQRQQMLWDAKFQQLSKVLKITKADVDRAAKAAENVGHMSPEKPKRRRTLSRSRTKSGSERTLSFSDFSDNDVDGPKERMRRASGQERARHSSGSSVKSRKNSMGESHADAALQNHTLLDNGQGVVTYNHSSNPSTSVELMRELTLFASEKLSSRHVLPLSELRRLFSLKLAECPPGHILGSGVSDHLLQQAAIEAGGVSVGCSSIDEPLYAAASFGDGLDHLRTVILESFKLTDRLRMASLKKRLEESPGPQLQESEIKKILRDYCVSKNGGYWVLKGTPNS